MSQRIELTGTRFGRLVVTHYVGGIKWGCVCDCGAAIEAASQELRLGKTKSCGCYRKEVTGQQLRTHGMSRSPIYKIWAGAKARCNTKSASGYHNYGGRGIAMCPEWEESFEKFEEDMPGYAAGLSLERDDNDGPYCKDNCKWIPVGDQQRNQRKTIFFEGKNLYVWAAETGIKPGTLHARLKKFKTLFPPHLPRTAWSATTVPIT